MTNLKYFIPVGIVLLGVLAWATFSLASVSFTTPTQPVNTYKNFTFFTATTTTATSTNTTDGGGYFVVAGAKKIVVYFTHGGTATTSTTGQTFKVQSTRDGTNWDDLSRLLGQDVSATATSTYAIQGATSTVVVAIDITNKTFYAIRCVSAEFAGALATDGEATCIGSAEF
jgi:hypothetical protein